MEGFREHSCHFKLKKKNQEIYKDTPTEKQKRLRTCVSQCSYLAEEEKNETLTLSPLTLQAVQAQCLQQGCPDENSLHL